MPFNKIYLEGDICLKSKNIHNAKVLLINNISRHEFNIKNKINYNIDSSTNKLKNDEIDFRKYIEENYPLF